MRHPEDLCISPWQQDWDVGPTCANLPGLMRDLGMEQSGPRPTVKKEMVPGPHIHQFLANHSLERSVQPLQVQFLNMHVQNLRLHTKVRWSGDTKSILTDQAPNICRVSLHQVAAFLFNGSFNRSWNSRDYHWFNSHSWWVGSSGTYLTGINSSAEPRHSIKSPRNPVFSEQCFNL